jgi:hypothetical protein
MMTALSAALASASRRIVARLEELERRLDRGDETAWPDLLATVETAARLDERLVPGAHGELLTTREMADRLHVKPKTLLRRKAAGHATPALARGKLIRWRA